MTKEQVNDIASKATAGSNAALVVIGMMAWNTMRDVEKKLDAHMAQTTKIVESLERRVESIERKIGGVSNDKNRNNVDGWTP
jgi:hypothetical protein